MFPISQTEPNISKTDKNLPRTRKTGAIGQPVFIPIISQNNFLHENFDETQEDNERLNETSRKDTQVNDAKSDSSHDNACEVNVNIENVCETREQNYGTIDGSNIRDNSNLSSNEIVNIGTSKKNSIPTSVQGEIKRSLSRTKLVSISVIKNIFKKSKRFRQNSLSLNAGDAVVPNFIFKYHKEEFVDEELPHSAKDGFFRLCCTTLAIGLNTLICGIILGYTFPELSTLELPSYLFNKTSLKEVNLKSSKYAFVLGCLCSCLVWWCIINRIGRRRTNLLSSLLYLSCFIILLYPLDTTYSELIASALAGIGAATCFINSYFFIPECAEDRMKVITSVIFISLLWIGMYLAKLVIMFSTFINLIYVCIILTVVSFIFVFLLPESPVFYVQKNDILSARKSIRWFKHRDNDPLVSYELTLIISRFTEKNKALSKDCFLNDSNLNALSLSLMLMVGFSVNTLIFFSMYSSISYLSMTRIHPFVLDTFIFILPSIILLVLIKYYQNSQRKKLLIVSYSFVAISLLFLSICMTFVGSGDVFSPFERSFISWVVLICFLVFVPNALLGSFVVPHILFFEMFSYETISLCLSVLYLFSYFIISVFMMLSSLVLSFVGFGMCLFLAAVLFLCLIKFVILYLPETKGDSFQQTRKRLRRLQRFSRVKKVSIFTIGDGERE